MYLFVCLFDCTRVWSHAHLVSFCLTLVTIFAEIPYGHISLHVICSSILESTCSEDYDMTGLRNQTPFRSGDLNPRFSVIFPPMIWIFMWSEEPEIKSKQASKRDRTLKKLMKRPNRKRYRSIDIWALAPMIFTEKSWRWDKNDQKKFELGFNRVEYYILCDGCLSS